MILVEVPMTGKPNTSNMSLYVLEYHQIENYEEYPLGAYTGDIVSLHFPANEGLTAAKKIIAAFQGGQRFGGKKEGLFISSIQEYK
jgi:hypothetical protein